MELTSAVRQYLNALTAHAASRYTVRGAKSALKELVSFLKAIEVTRIEQLDHDALMQYREELSWRLTRFNTPLSPRSQSELLGHLRAFCRWMVTQDWLIADPSKKIPNPKKPQQLPKSILEPREIDKLLSLPDLTTARGYRDRVILEVLYATAMRREEAANLKLEDLDTESGYAVIRQGKGNKDRVVPIGTSVCQLIDTYSAGVRADWINSENEAHLFLNRFGQKMNPDAIWSVVRADSDQFGTAVWGDSVRRSGEAGTVLWVVNCDRGMAIVSSCARAYVAVFLRIDSPLSSIL